MNAEQIKKLIEQENDNRADQTASAARQIIREIGKQQDGINEHVARIAELREELKKLSHDEINVSQIIG